MLILRLYRWGCGYVSFKTHGGFPERFLNLCAMRQITVWGVKIKNGSLQGKMLCRDYKQIKNIAKMSEAVPKIRKKCGFRFTAKHYSNRYGLAAGAVSGILLLCLLSGCIWNVNISGNSKVDDKLILSQLEKIGVYEGVRAKSIDTELCRQQLLIAMPQLSWCAVNIDGCFATVDVRETRDKKEEEKTSYPANIIAKQGGTILSIKAYYGVPTVKVGQAVAKGDLLISGTVEDKNGGVVYSEARAQIMARTVRTLSEYVPFEQIGYENISKPVRRKIIKLFGIGVPLFFGNVEKPYSVRRTQNIPVINGKRLPICIDEAVFIKQREYKYTLERDEAVKKAQNIIDKKCEKELGKIIKQKLKSDIKERKDGVELVCSYECEEDIGTPKKILLN